MDAIDFVNELPPPSRLGAIKDFLQEEGLGSPVDMYRQSIENMLRYGTQERLDDSSFLGRLLVSGIISAAEAYFRGVLSECIELCPLARSNASDKNVNLGGLLWHGPVGFSRSAFENFSFTSKKALVQSCKDYIDFKLEDGIFKDLLDQFEIVCQIRHGIVHGDGLLPGKNAVQLDIKRYRKPVRIIVGYEQVQDVAAVINTLVMTFNRQLFAEMCNRWATRWRKRADWDPAAENQSFAAIWKIFYCRVEARTRRGRKDLTKSNCQSAVKGKYNI